VSGKQNLRLFLAQRSTCLANTSNLAKMIATKMIELKNTGKKLANHIFPMTFLAKMIITKMIQVESHCKKIRQPYLSHNHLLKKDHYHEK
jgi:hypothetical protein